MATSPPAPLPTLTLSQVRASEAPHGKAHRPRQRPHAANAIEFRSSDSRTDFSDASSLARSGAVELTAAKTRALASVGNAQRAGFTVSDDLSVRDSLAVPSKPLRLVRDVQAQAFAADIRAQSTTLAATDQSVASKLSTITAGFTGYEFRESPFPQEPPPPQIPFPPYEPKLWGACAARGADPNKVVRTLQPGTDQRRISIPTGRR